MQDARTRLEAILRERIAVLDGSWGVLIQRQVRGEEAYRGERFKDHPHDVAGDPDLLNLTRPEIVLDIHRQYFAAGADIATTNTFTATSIGQADYALELHVRELNHEGARLARWAADEVGGFVAGSVGPLNVTLARAAPTWVACHPNAGLPNEMGTHDEQPRDTSRYLREFAQDGLVNIVGGCCGTTPEHVKAIKSLVQGQSPRRVPQPEAVTRLS